MNKNSEILLTIFKKIYLYKFWIDQTIQNLFNLNQNFLELSLFAKKFKTGQIMKLQLTKNP